MHTLPVHKESVAVIMAGGDGKRLWPISTSEVPKQINPVFSKKTLLVEAYERARALFPPERILVVTTDELAGSLKQIVDLPEKNWVLQPTNADTAAAMCVTALHLDALFPESTAILFYSDHKVSRVADFQRAVRAVKDMAQKSDALVMIGTRPTFANTQFGYIQLGEPVSNQESFFTVAGFEEKPDLETAKKYVSANKYVWNTGVYAWQTSTLLRSLKEVAPEYYESLVALRVVIGDSSYLPKLEAWFDSIQHLAFEKVVSEKLKTMYVYVGSYVWDDVGNWKTVYELAEKDDEKNVVLQKQEDQTVQFSKATGNMVLATSKQVVVMGMQDTFVIETDDTLLVCHKDHVAEVKHYALTQED